MKRKDFIVKCSSVCLGGLGFSLVLESCGSANYFAKHTVNSRKIFLAKSEFDALQKEKPVKRPFVLIKNDALEFPICVYRFDDEKYKALFLKCTHQGCEVQPHSEFLVCPCHGSEYSNLGKVINPPAEQDLKEYPLAIDGDTIVIEL